MSSSHSGVSTSLPVASTGDIDVFISYSSYNKTEADIIVNELEQHGIRCWYAPRNIPVGKTWASAITEALNAAPIVVLIYTHDSNASQQVLNEINLANASNKTIVPFRLSDEPMNDQLSFYLARMQWIDAQSSSLYDDVVPLRNHLLSQLSGAKGLRSKAAPYARPGLWWTAIEPDGLFAIFPKQTWYWQTILLAALIAILILVPSTRQRYLFVPLALIGFNLSSTTLMGKWGLKVTLPLVTYACSAIAWMMAFTKTSPRLPASYTAAVAGVFLLTAVICSSQLPVAKRDQQGSMLCMTAIVSACVLGCAIAYRGTYIDTESVQLLAGICYFLPLTQSVVLTIEQYKTTAEKVPRDTRRKQLIERLAMFSLGIVPLAIASLLAKAGSPVVLLATLVAYAALGIFSFTHLKRSTHDLSALFVPASLSGTASLIAQAKTKYLPFARYVRAVITVFRSSSIGKVISASGKALVKAFSWLLGKPVTYLLGLLSGTDGASVSQRVVRALCLPIGIVVIASVAGVAVSLHLYATSKRAKDDSGSVPLEDNKMMQS